MRRQVGLVGWYRRTQETQVFEFPALGKRCIDFAANRNGECGVVAKQAEEDEIVVADIGFDIGSLEQNRRRRVSTHETAVRPDRHEARLIIRERLGQPVGILSAFAVTIDERTRKDVMVFD